MTMADFNLQTPTFWQEYWAGQANNSIKSNGGQSCQQTWIDYQKAQAYTDRSVRNYQRLNKVISSLQAVLTPQSQVLDIGGGGGTVALALAPWSKKVTVIEPAPGMQTVLKNNIERSGISNIELVPKNWEEVSLQDDLKNEQYELVFFSFSLGMPDLAATIEKVLAVAKAKIFFFWFNGIPFWQTEKIKLWPLLHQKAYLTGPKIDILYNYLYQRGIYPNLEAHTFEYNEEYQSTSLYLQHLEQEFQTETETQKKILRVAYQLDETSHQPITVTYKASYSKLWWDVRFPQGTA